MGGRNLAGLGVRRPLQTGFQSRIIAPFGSYAKFSAIPLSIMTYITQIYCQSADCNVREVEVMTKDHGNQPEPEKWRCPGCGKPAKLHWRRTLVEHERIEAQNAIGRVNSALYVRDSVGEGELAAIPLNVFALDKLPESWKCQQ